MKSTEKLKKKMYILDEDTHVKIKLLAVEEKVNIRDIIKKAIECYATLKKHNSL